jgi:hypothetical protein
MGRGRLNLLQEDPVFNALRIEPRRSRPMLPASLR